MAYESTRIIFLVALLADNVLAGRGCLLYCARLVGKKAVVIHSPALS